MGVEGIEKLFADWRDSAMECAAAKGEMIYLTEFRKSKKAILMGDYERKNPGCPQWRAEQYAYSHEDYVALLLGLKASVEKYEELRIRQKVAEERVNVWRTKQANSRKEFTAYGN